MSEEASAIAAISPRLICECEAERDAALAERDRLRREVEALRDSLRTNLAWGQSEDVDAFWHELDAILRGEP